MTSKERTRHGKRMHDGEVSGLGGCPRGFGDCYALARYASPKYESFMCCGEPANPPVAADVLRLCIKAIHAHGVDIMVNLDPRDAVHTASVLLSGLSYTGSAGLTPVEADSRPTGGERLPDGEEGGTTRTWIL